MSDNPIPTRAPAMDAAYLTVDASNRSSKRRAKWHAPQTMFGRVATRCSGLWVAESSANLPAAVPPANRCGANGCRQRWTTAPAYDAEKYGSA